MRPTIPALLLVALLTAPVAAQTDDAAAALEAGDLGEASAAALEAIRGAGKDRLMVGDLMGAKLGGESGEPVGTIDNLVAIPGGRLVALVVSLDDGETVAVPYQLVKITQPAGAVGVSLSRPLDEVLNTPAVKELSGALGL